MGTRRTTTRPQGALMILAGQSDAAEQWSTGYANDLAAAERSWRKRVTAYRGLTVHEEVETEERAREFEARLVADYRRQGKVCASYGKNAEAETGPWKVFTVEHSGLIYHDGGRVFAAMARVWMELAVEQDRRQKARMNSEDLQVEARAVLTFSVVTVCAGLSYELIWKALAQAEGRIAAATHRPSAILEGVSERTRKLVEQAAQTAGWSDLEELHEFLDNHLCNPDEKYALRTPDGRGGRSTGYWKTGIRSLPELEKLHNRVSQIWDVTMNVNWPNSVR